MKLLVGLCEALGTCLLVLSVLASGNWLVVGATLAVVLWLIGDISGGHVNPVITLIMYMNGSFGAGKSVQYVAAQTIGGLAALYLFRILGAM
jgi:glycerol uptake facilitator-like aquaporin